MESAHIIRFVVCILSGVFCFASGSYIRHRGNPIGGTVLLYGGFHIILFSAKQFKAEMDKAKSQKMVASGIRGNANEN